MPDTEDSPDARDEGGVEDAREASSRESLASFGFGGFKEAYGCRDMTEWIKKAGTSCVVKGGG